MDNKLKNIYHDKQYKILDRALRSDFFILVNHGAKRSGKTIINNDLFLIELQRIGEIAMAHGVKDPQYILAGNTLGSLYRNVLKELESKYNLEFKMDKFNRFKLLGVQVCCFGHGKINDLGRIRGMTAFGAYINEGTTANREVYQEIISRCSGVGARILVDTNSDYPGHWLKKDYIDKADDQRIIEYSWKLRDNTFLDDRYIENIENSTPSGVFTDRHINGLWVAGEGSVYSDFERSRHYIAADQLKDYNIIKYIGGVDWGYKHNGAIVVVAKTAAGQYILIEETTATEKPIDYWVRAAKDIAAKYPGIVFYCDSARPDNISEFDAAGLVSYNADKSVLPGIEFISSLFKTDLLKIVENNVSIFKDEIYLYRWNEKTGDVVKENDDVLDALRYAIYTDKESENIISFTDVSRLGL